MKLFFKILLLTVSSVLAATEPFRESTPLEQKLAKAKEEKAISDAIAENEKDCSEKRSLLVIMQLFSLIDMILW